MIHKRPCGDRDKVLVIFEIPGLVWADRIHLVGDFNDWDRESLPFQLNRQDNWQVQVKVERGREYRFRYLVDGEQWWSDWHADRHLAGPDGGFDSVVITGTPPALRAQPPRAA